MRATESNGIRQSGGRASDLGSVIAFKSLPARSYHAKESMASAQAVPLDCCRGNASFHWSRVC